ncbi:hypothetical protein [Ferribacterium limneticum]|uniref:hypothetical protein n=1 Tax=Ferribacterium limneticum TaxID=76259 RepID=UPI001CFAD8AC|nr:hypothetical protein [Ferribacterium limneticum]UCV27450.1 hypothetical protein KI617_14380 [Ferribacterium limneticum]UCV31367.1 hypothetical protein KI608_14380 [Ferribacterium limneticum]
MTHPVVLKTSQLILAGDLKGAETALANIADTEGDDALVTVLNDVPPKDLLAVMRGFDGSKQSVVNMVVTPDQFARAVVLEARYRDETHAALHGMMNAVLYRDDDLTAEYLEAIGEMEGGYEVLANYFGERDDELLAFAISGVFSEDFNAEHGHESKSISWLNEKIEEIDEALHEGNSITGSRPKVSRSEISDRDWMETAWVLRYELSDIFEQVVITLRDRLQHRIEVLEEPPVMESKPAASSASSFDDEESAL